MELPHPLLTDTISTEICQYLDFKDLKTYRQVCKKWSTTSFATFEAKATLCGKFNEIDKSILEFTNTFKSAYDENRVYKSMQLVTPGHLKCILLVNWFEKYGEKLERFQLGSDVEQPLHNEMSSTGLELRQFSIPVLSNILREWCPNLMHLKITFPRWNANYSLANQIPKNINQGESRTRLHTLVVQDSNKDRDTVEVIYIAVVLLTAGIESVTLIGPTTCGPKFNTIAKLFNNDQKQNWFTIPTLASLTKLILNDYLVSTTAFKSLCKYTFKTLKEISFGPLFVVDNTVQDFQNFLISIGQRLETLSLLDKGPNFAEVPRPAVIQILESTLSKMKALQTLRVHLSNWDIGTLDSILSSLPNLKHLGVAVPLSLLKTFFGETNEIYQNKNIVSGCFLGKLDNEMVQKLANCCPNLKGIKLGVEGIDAIRPLSKLKNLEKLVVILDKNCVTGRNTLIDMAKFKALKKMVVKQTSKTETLGEMVYFSLDDFRDGLLTAPALTSLELVRIKISLESFLSFRDNKVKVRLTKCVIVT